MSIAALAAGDVAAADEANEAAWQHISLELEMSKISIWRRAHVALARGDLIAARRWADEAHWFELPGLAGHYDPVFGFDCAGYRVTIYGTPAKKPGWGWAVRPDPGSDSDIGTNWSFTAAEAKQDAWRELVRLIRGGFFGGLPRT